MSRPSNRSLFGISHQNNRMFLSASKYEIIYENDPRVTVADPRVVIYVRWTHQVVPENLSHDIPQPLGRGLRHILSEAWLSHSLSLLSAGGKDCATSAFESMLTGTEIPFDLGDEDSHGPLHWRESVRDTEIDRPGDFRLEGVSGAAAKVLEKFVQTVAGAQSLRPPGQQLAEIQFSVKIVKRTVVNSEVYRSFPKVRFNAAVNSLEKVTCGGGGDESETSECSICLKDVPSGTRVSRLPCSHWFHMDCIVTWFERSQTCPCCRFELVKHYFRI